MGDCAVAWFWTFGALSGMAGLLCFFSVCLPMLYGTVHRGSARSGSESSGGWVGSLVIALINNQHCNIA